MPRKKVKSYKKTSKERVGDLFELHNFALEPIPPKVHLQKLLNWTCFLYNVLDGLVHIIKETCPVQKHLKVAFWQDGASGKKVAF